MGDAVRYTPGAREVDHDGLAWFLAELAPGDALVWVCQDGQIRPLGNGPEVPHSWQRGPVTSRLLAQLREGERQ
jgi:hypothetical protein